MGRPPGALPNHWNRSGAADGPRALIFPEPHLPRARKSRWNPESQRTCQVATRSLPKLPRFRVTSAPSE